MTHHDALRLIDTLKFFGFMNLFMLSLVLAAIFATDR